MAIDAVNILYEDLFGKPKYVNWYSCLSLDLKHSTYGVVLLQPDNERPNSSIAPIDKALTVRSKLSRTIRYLARRQNCRIPTAPAKAKDEKKLFSELKACLLHEKLSLSAMSTFTEMMRCCNALLKILTQS